MMNNITNILPLELIYYIVKNLDDESIMMLSSTCKELRYLLDKCIKSKCIYFSDIMNVSKSRKLKNTFYTKLSWEYKIFYNCFDDLKCVGNTQYINKNINHLIIDKSDLIYQDEMEKDGDIMNLYRYKFRYSKKKNTLKFLDNIVIISFNPLDLYYLGNISLNSLPLPNLKYINIRCDNLDYIFDKDNDRYFSFWIRLHSKNDITIYTTYKNKITSTLIILKEDYKIVTREYTQYYHAIGSIEITRENSRYKLFYKP